MAVKNDGSLVTGDGYLVSIGNTNYIMHSVETTQGSTTVEGRDENNKPDKQKTYPEFETGQAVLLWPSAAPDDVPEVGADINIPDIANNTTISVHISEVGKPYVRGEEARVTVSLRKNYN